MAPYPKSQFKDVLLDGNDFVYNNLKVTFVFLIWFYVIKLLSLNSNSLMFISYSVWAMGLVMLAYYYIVKLPIQMADNLVVYYQNCRGIRTKLQILYMNILSNCYDNIILTETWLTPEISDNEFIDSRYVVYRCDRDRTATNKKDGGGVLVAVLKGLRSVRIVTRFSLEPKWNTSF